MLETSDEESGDFRARVSSLVGSAANCYLRTTRETHFLPRVRLPGAGYSALGGSGGRGVAPAASPSPATPDDPRPSSLRSSTRRAFAAWSLRRTTTTASAAKAASGPPPRRRRTVAARRLRDPDSGRFRRRRRRRRLGASPRGANASAVSSRRGRSGPTRGSEGRPGFDVVGAGRRGDRRPRRFRPRRPTIVAGLERGEWCPAAPPRSRARVPPMPPRNPDAGCAVEAEAAEEERRRRRASRAAMDDRAGGERRRRRRGRWRRARPARAACASAPRSERLPRPRRGRARSPSSG